MGSISETWFWLIHVLFLGWGLLAVLAFVIWLAWAVIREALKG
jgi:flagellar biogenesis protein FliO